MAINSDKPIIWGAAAAVVAGAIALFLYAHREHPAPAPEASSPEVRNIAPAALPPVTPSAPLIEHPVPADSAPEGAPAPGLDQSDPAFHQALIGLPGASPLEKLLVPENIIRHIVVTVDNLARKKFAVNQRPVKPTAGDFMTLANGEKVSIDPQNYARYRPFMEVVKAADPQTVVHLYYHFYPLFQSAFDDLGYKDAYFNDHLITLIDQLLATPDVAAPIVLVQPNVMYLYADPALEALSPGQKTLIRMGPDNEAVLKARLREFKAQLLAQQRPRP